jgi:hypothetical protein
MKEEDLERLIRAARRANPEVVTGPPAGFADRVFRQRQTILRENRFTSRSLVISMVTAGIVLALAVSSNFGAVAAAISMPDDQDPVYELAESSLWDPVGN